MTIETIINALDAKIMTPELNPDREVTSAYVGDLLSIVMSKAKKDCIWITIQSHINIIAVATLVDMSCIIISEGFDIEKDTLEKAVEEKIILLKVNATSYEICRQLSMLGITD